MPLMTEPDGSWLCEEGEYQNLVKNLVGCDPRLRQRDPRTVGQDNPWYRRTARVVALQMGADQKWQPEVEFTKAEAFKAHLQESAKNNNLRSVYLMEGLSRAFISVLGPQFNLHPSMFVDHERVTVFDNDPRGGENDSMPLPSVFCSRNHFCLKYYEPLELAPPPNQHRVFCADTGRQIAVTRLRIGYLPVGTIRRKCTLWSKKRGDGWDCLILCDPPLKRLGAMVGKRHRRSAQVKISLFQGGYIDFMPYNDQLRTQKGPPRTSMVDDLLFYLKTYADLLPDLDDPKAPAIFVKKLVASHYLRLSEFLRSTLSVIQRGLTRKDDLSCFDVPMVERQWSDMQTWVRRMAEYVANLELTMTQLRIATVTAAYEPNNAPLPWYDVAVDFQVLLSRMRELRHRAELLNADTTGLANIAGNRQAFNEQELSLKVANQSVEEAKRMKALTLLSFIFFPLATTSQLLSMSEDYLPGGKQFWIFWVISIPMVLLLFTAYHLWESGYANWDTWKWRADDEIKQQIPCVWQQRGDGCIEIERLPRSSSWATSIPGPPKPTYTNNTLCSTW